MQTNASDSPAASPAGRTEGAPRRRLHALHVHISVLFTLLIVASSTIIGWYNYHQTSSIFLSASDDVFERIGRETLLEIERIYAPIGLLTDLLATHPITAAASLDARLSGLPSLQEGLAHIPALSAFYVGYDDGDFFLVRPLPPAGKLRDDLGAPPGAAFLVQSLERDKELITAAKYVYLDQTLKPTQTSERRDYKFDPRTRAWFSLASAAERQIKTPPYVFYTTGEPGITVARKSVRGGAVVGADVTLAQLSSTLRRQAITPSAELVLFDGAGRALAYNKTDRPLWKRNADATLELATLADLGGTVAAGLQSVHGRGAHGTSFDFSADRRDWIGRISKVNAGEPDIFLGVLVPRDELLSEAARIRAESMVITLGILLLTIPIAWALSLVVSRPLRRLSAQAAAIQKFNFEKGDEIDSFVLEINDLARATDVMRTTIRKFLEISTALAGEKDLDRLLDRMAAESLAIARADAAVVYLVDDDGARLVPSHGSLRETQRMPAQSMPPPLDLERDRANLIVVAAREGDSRVAVLGPAAMDPTAHYLEHAFAGLGVERLVLAAIPLHNRQGEVVGVLAFGRRRRDSGRAAPFPAELVSFMEALSGTIAISIEARRLLKAQKDLLASLIQLVASAIDAKSRYTGGHCQRVPEIAKMLAQAACDATEGPYRDFTLGDEDWEAVHIASWLHDCGKVTTPEYVVDKATKLETIYDRIHEIRTRFEVLKRDAEIEHWQAVAAGADAGESRKTLAAKLAELDADFAFVADCNVGGEFMAPAKLERLERIAARTWLRTLDDRIGISHDERNRSERIPAPPLPVRERVLADKDEHIVERGPLDDMPPDNAWGFKLDVPRYKYNKGELHNLRIGRGTLTQEERFIINDHVVQTIIMLGRLPFPKHLKQVPEIAGGHHEKVDGTGYPKRLRHAEMSPVARMLAIADIFEALTAVDRPYKQGKTLSESIGIMGGMVRAGHIDAQLFELFLSSGVYLQYGRRYLRPEQVDDVDIGPYLATATP